MANLPRTDTRSSSRSRLIGIVVVLVAAGALVGGICGSGRCQSNRSSGTASSSNAVSNELEYPTPQPVPVTFAGSMNGTAIFSARPTMLANSSLSPATQNTTRTPTIDSSSPARTTELPSSQALTAANPVTTSPVMKATVTESPRTNNPTTEAPTALAPETNSPITKAPTTNSPITEAPTTKAPTTKAPTTKAPTTKAPTTKAPTTEAPTTEAPTTEAPLTPTPVTNPPTTYFPSAAVTTTTTTNTELVGALITNDCQFLDYSYAIDIYWSCGEERFQQPLRLHTFKRHSRSHRFVFADQRITYRSQQLWFDGYNVPRCVRIVANNNEWRLGTNDCTNFRLLQGGSGTTFVLQDMATSLCAVTTFCNDDESTGGRECGGVDHRFLPLLMGSCNSSSALTFSFAPLAEVCANERPGNACF